MIRLTSITSLHFCILICATTSGEDGSNVTVHSRNKHSNNVTDEDYKFVEDYVKSQKLKLRENCPPFEEDKIFLLVYTRQNSPFYYNMTVDEVASLKNSTLDPSKPTKLLVHGWLINGTAPGESLGRAYLNVSDVNVISLDWGGYSTCEHFFIRDHIISNVGKVGAKILAKLHERGANPDTFHVIGHSYGAHIAGFVGKYSNFSIGRITGLDPSRPGYENLPSSERFDTSDGAFVDVIMSNLGPIGVTYEVGHVRFFPNGGTDQPGCEDMTCSHIRSQQYFMESITGVKNLYCAKLCDSYSEFNTKRCRANLTNYMGEYVSRNLHGTYYLNTSNKQPYGLGC